MVAAVLGVVLAGCGGGEDEPTVGTTGPAASEETEPAAPEEGRVELTVTSPAFAEGDTVPVEHTCDGADESPPLAISDIPDDAVSLVVIMDDPDAPSGTFDHWVSYDADVTTEVPAGTEPGTAGVNSFGVTGYRGPCPPAGDPHRYVFTVLALDSTLDLAEGETKATVLEAAADHTVAEGSLTGQYGR